MRDADADADAVLIEWRRGFESMTQERNFFTPEGGRRMKVFFVMPGFCFWLSFLNSNNYVNARPEICCISPSLTSV